MSLPANSPEIKLHFQMHVVSFPNGKLHAILISQPVSAPHVTVNPASAHGHANCRPRIPWGKNINGMFFFMNASTAQIWCKVSCFERYFASRQMRIP
jgi:hypothetical protein